MAFSPLRAIDPRLTPGGYMRDCRQRASLTISQCAAIIAPSGDRDRAKADLRAMESNQPGDYLRLVTALRDRGAFRFDFAAFLLLVSQTTDPTQDPQALDHG